MCNFTNGDIKGGAEKLIGNANNEYECANLVKTKKPFAKGAKYDFETKCYAEFGDLITNSSKFRTCIFKGEHYLTTRINIKRLILLCFLIFTKRIKFHCLYIKLYLDYCKDGVRNQGEIDVDCGGPCRKCGKRDFYGITYKVTKISF